MMVAKEQSPLIGKESSQEQPTNRSHNRSYSVLDLEDSAEHSAGGRITEIDQLARERLFDEKNGYVLSIMITLVIYMSY